MHFNKKRSLQAVEERKNNNKVYAAYNTVCSACQKPIAEGTPYFRDLGKNYCPTCADRVW